MTTLNKNLSGDILSVGCQMSANRTKQEEDVLMTSVAGKGESDNRKIWRTHGRRQGNDDDGDDIQV